MRRTLLLLLLAALALAGCGGDDAGGGAGDGAAPAAELGDLASVEQFAERFNADQGVPRLVVLVAPT